MTKNEAGSQSFSSVYNARARKTNQDYAFYLVYFRVSNILLFFTKSQKILEISRKSKIHNF